MGVNRSKKESTVLVVGLDNSGKSTIVNQLKPERKQKDETFPTVGYDEEKFSHSNVHFRAYDMSGQGRYRNLWEEYYADAVGILFVMDSADVARVCVAKDELETMLAHADIAKRAIPILFFANKMDLPKALSPAQLALDLDLAKLTDRPWQIVHSNALLGTGLDEGMKWFAAQVAKGGKAAKA